MSIDVKKLIKDAKAALASKQHKLAIDLCMQVLQEDNNNATVYLLLGAIYKDDNPKEAVKFLKEALKCSKDPTFAYIGLLKCAENDELPEICRKVLEHAPNKFAEVHRKLEDCALITKHTNTCIEILQNEIGTDENHARSAYETLLQIYMQGRELDKKWLELFKETFEIAIADRGTRDHARKFAKYLKILNHLKRWPLLLKRCDEMQRLYPKENIPLELICRVYAETFEDGEFNFEDYIPCGVERYADELLIINDVSPHALLAKGLYLYKNENYVAARDCLNKSNSNSVFSLLCLKTLAATHFKLRAFTLAEYCYVRCKLMNVNLIQSLIEQENESKTKEAISFAEPLLSTVGEEERFDLMEAMAKAFIQTNQNEKAEKFIQDLATANMTERVQMLNACKYQREHNFVAALEQFQSADSTSCIYLLEKGKCYFGLEKYQESLNEILKATKIQPYNSDCFHWLGKIYTINNDTDRARKCFEKSVFLNPQHEQSVVLLSTNYRQSTEWDLNLKLLQTAAQAIPNTSCKWAELQLGFHNLGQNNFDEAIMAFRAVLRLDPQSFATWEGLADAYLKRGSFNSALKVYQKICELTDDNFYPKLQVANIKTTLRLFKEAIVEYESVLKDDSSHVPALKGIADAHMGMARESTEQRLLGRAKDHAEHAVGYLIRAIQIRNNYVCLWRLLAQAFDFVAAMPMSKARLTIPGSLANDSEQEEVVLSGDKLYEFAARFYCRAIKINKTDYAVWYELALSYYNRATQFGMSEDLKQKYLELSAEATKFIIKESPKCWKYWNLLGIVCSTKEMNNIPLAQHAFIKALELDRKLATVWTNLGVLYMSQGMHMLKLANAAFSQAQQSEPSYSNAWTGQAHIAEMYDKLETVDLLTHSISLGYNDESSIRYAYWVCSVLNDFNGEADGNKQIDKRLRYAIENMHAISTALDSVTWYCDAKDSEITAEALCCLGYLYYKQRHWRNACLAFKMAVEKTEDKSQRDKMLSNLAYTYLKNDQPLEAVEAFNGVTEATFRSTIGLAYAHFKAKQYENSYSVYESALEWLATNDREKALILVAMSSMVYAFQGESDAKTVLFQCIDLPNPPIEALFSVCALGILHNDTEMSELVLKELESYKRNPNWSHHIAFFTTELYLKKNQEKQALTYLYSEIHKFPDRPLLRKVLANFLLRRNKKTEKHFLVANRMVESVITMQRVDINCHMSSMDVAKLLALASEAMRCINLNVSKKLAQKALHVNPVCKEAWAAHTLLHA